MEAIKTELEAMQAYLEITISENPAEVVERGATLQVYMARSGKMLADAKQELNKAMQSEVMEIIRKVAQDAGASHTAVNALVKSACRDQQYIVDWVERINRSCTHQLDYCRTLLSKYKEEMRTSNFHFQNMPNK